MKRILASLAMAGCLCFPVGCKTAGVTGQPTAPDLNTPYQKAATAMSAFASDVLSAQQIVINLHKGAVIDKATDTSIQNRFKDISAYGKQIDALILAQASAATIQAKVNAALDSLSAITAQTGKLDPATLLQVQTSITAIRQVLGTVLSAFNLTTSEVIYGSPYNRSLSGAGSIARVANLPSSSLGTGCNHASTRGDYCRSRRQVRPDWASSRRGDRSVLDLAA